MKVKGTKGRKPKWQDAPDWKKQVNTVLACRERGLEEDQIIALTQYDPHAIRRIIEDETIAEERAKKNFAEKVPVIKDIVGMSLEVIRETLKEMCADPEFRRQMVENAKALTSLTGVIKDLNELLRLDQGQSTANVAMESRGYQETRIAIQNLKTLDPVFEYPMTTDES